MVLRPLGSAPSGTPHLPASPFYLPAPRTAATYPPISNFQFLTHARSPNFANPAACTTAPQSVSRPITHNAMVLRPLGSAPSGTPHLPASPFYLPAPPQTAATYPPISNFQFPTHALSPNFANPAASTSSAGVEHHATTLTATPFSPQ